ncbi:unnamed protein product [Diamesa serratosioi]
MIYTLLLRALPALIAFSPLPFADYHAEKPIFTIGEPPAAIANGDNFSEISLDRDTGSEMSPPPSDFTNNNLYSPLAEMDAFSSMPPTIKVQQQQQQSFVDSNFNPLTAALAQLPNAASTVFSTFSNIIKGTAPPTSSTSQVQNNLTFNDPMAELLLTQPYSYGYPTEPEQITAPPPLFSPTDESLFKKVPTETILENNFRMGGLKKKTYAHIPGLSTNQQTLPQNAVSTFNHMPQMPPMPIKPQSDQFQPNYQPPPMLENYNTNYDNTDCREPEKSNKFSFASLIPTQLLEKLPVPSNLSNLFGGSDATSSFAAPQMTANDIFTVNTGDSLMNQQDQPQMTQGQPQMNFFNPQQFQTNPFERQVQSSEPPITNNYQTVPLASQNMNQLNINDGSQMNLQQEPINQEQCQPQPTFFNPMEASKINSGRTRLSRYKNPNLIEVSNKAPILIPPIANLFNQPTQVPKESPCFQKTPLHTLTFSPEQQRPPSNTAVGDASDVRQFISPPPLESSAIHPPSTTSFPPQQKQPLVAAPVIDSNPPVASMFFSPEISQPPVKEPTLLWPSVDPIKENVLPIPPQCEDDIKQLFDNVEEYCQSESLPCVQSDMSETFETMSLSGRSGSYVGSNLSLFATSELDSMAAMPTQSTLIGDFLNKQQDVLSTNGSSSVKSVSVTAIKSYRPVYKHWFYQNDELWIPFSMTDSLSLDDGLASGKDIVRTDSGRFDVSMNNKLRVPVFWNSNPNEIRRCSWFYKNAEAKLVPFDESSANLMENSFEMACNSGVWSCKLQLTNPEEFFEIQDSTVMFYLKDGQCFVVKRGVDEFDINDGEAEKVDHLMILVSGFESCCLSDLSDELRSKTRDLVQQNYSEASDCGLVGRIEVLPVVFESEEFNLRYDRMKSVASSKELEMTHQFNAQLLKSICYGNAEYHKQILEHFSESLSKLFKLFCEKNPCFVGKVSIAASGLESLFVFDFMCNTELPFKVQSFFALGMPSGLLKSSSLNGMLEAPKMCEKFFNIAHPSDSLAQRFEPLVNTSAMENPSKLIDDQQLNCDASTIDFTLPNDTSFESSSLLLNFKPEYYWHSDKLSLLLVREIYSEIKVDGMFC